MDRAPIEVPEPSKRGPGWWLWRPADGRVGTRVDRLEGRLWRVTIYIREGSGFIFGRFEVQDAKNLGEVLRDAERRCWIMEPPIKLGWADKVEGMG